MRIIRPCPCHGKRATGFTLIELMVVMLLVTIILAVTIPRFNLDILQDPAKKLTRRMINTVRAMRSQAIHQQQLKMLVIDLDNQRLWSAGVAQEEESEAETRKKTFDLPSSLRFVEIQFPGREPINSGIVEIYFYPAGYSDHVILHVQNENQDRFAYIVEPLLPKVKLLEEWIDL